MWDDKNILERASATDNMIELVQAKLHKLPPHFVPLLNLAACLGHELSVETLKLVWQELEAGCRQNSTTSDDDCDDESSGFLDSSLAKLLKEGILDYAQEGSNERYLWIHDKIQEAALTLGDDKTLGDLKQRVGTVLASKLEAQDLDTSIFVAVDLLGQGRVPQDPQQRELLAKCNLRAVQKAVRLA